MLLRATLAFPLAALGPAEPAQAQASSIVSAHGAS